MLHVFLLVVMFQGAEQRSQPMYFYSIDRCLYFAERLSNQRSVPAGDNRRLNITAVCKPIPKLGK